MIVIKQNAQTELCGGIPEFHIFTVGPLISETYSLNNIQTVYKVRFLSRSYYNNSKI